MQAPVLIHYEGLSIHFLGINIQNVCVVYPKAVILYGGFPLKKAVTRVRTVKVTLYVHENLTFKLTKNRRVNIQKTLRFKTNNKIKYTVGNINKTKMKMVAERDLLLIIILRERREKRKPRVLGETSLLRK